MRRYTQDEIVTEAMATRLHKYMAIACSSYLVPDIQQRCPGWPWLLMEMDAQVAKRKGIHLGEQQSFESKSTASLLARIESL